MFVRSLRQILALLQMSLGALGGRVGPALVIVVGTTCVVGVLISMLSMGAGVRRLAMNGARADRAVVVTGGGQRAGTPLSKEAVFTISDMPGVKRDPNGKSIASGIAVAIIEGRARLDDARVMFPVLGVEGRYSELAPELHLTGGRMFHPAVHELLVGKARHVEEKGLEIGDRVRLRGENWTVVGHFESGGSADGTAMTDAETLMSDFHLGTFQSVAVMLKSPGEFDEFKRMLEANPSINVEVKHEREYLAEQMKGFTTVLDFVSYFVGTVMGVGATVGAVSAMYALVDSRRREFAMLSAIGFGSFAIVAAVLIESLLLALPGAVMGAVMALVLFNGNHVSPAGFAMQLAVTPQVVALGMFWALCMGLLGGLMPALRASRVSVIAALRAT
jgi:putative ABC transport system permease protein